MLWLHEGARSELALFLLNHVSECQHSIDKKIRIQVKYFASNHPLSSENSLPLNRPAQKCINMQGGWVGWWRGWSGIWKWLHFSDSSDLQIASLAVKKGVTWKVDIVWMYFKYKYMLPRSGADVKVMQKQVESALPMTTFRPPPPSSPPKTSPPALP